MIIPIIIILVALAIAIVIAYKSLKILIDNMYKKPIPIGIIFALISFFYARAFARIIIMIVMMIKEVL